MPDDSGATQVTNARPWDALRRALDDSPASVLVMAGPEHVLIQDSGFIAIAGREVARQRLGRRSADN